MNQVTIKYSGIIIGQQKLEGQFVAPETMVGYVHLTNAKPYISHGQTVKLVQEFLHRQHPALDLSDVVDLALCVEGLEFITLAPLKLKEGFCSAAPELDSYNVALKKKEEPAKSVQLTPKEELAELLRVPETERSQNTWVRIKRLRNQLRREQEKKEEQPTDDPNEKQHREYIARKSEERAYAEFTSKGGRR